jgi:hypothetical protein
MRTVDGTGARRVHDLGERFEPGSIMPGKRFEGPYVEVRLNQVASPA